MCAHTYSTQRYTKEQAYAHYIQSTQNSLPKAWLQLLQGSVRLANGWETSTRGGVGGGLGFFQPLHLQPSNWNKNIECQCATIITLKIPKKKKFSMFQ